MLPEWWLSNSGQVAQREPEYSVTSVICGLVIELITQKVFNTQCASIATMLPDDADSVCRDIFIGLSMD